MRKLELLPPEVKVNGVPYFSKHSKVLPSFKIESLKGDWVLFRGHCYYTCQNTVNIFTYPPETNSNYSPIRGSFCIKSLASPNNISVVKRSGPLYKRKLGIVKITRPDPNSNIHQSSANTQKYKDSTVNNFEFPHVDVWTIFLGPVLPKQIAWFWNKLYHFEYLQVCCRPPINVPA